MTRLGLLPLAAAVLCLIVAPSAFAGMMPRPAATRVLERPCPYQDEMNRGCAYSDGTVYVWPPDRWTLAHEIGHVFDSLVMSDGDRRWFRKFLDTRARKRWSETVAERFADAYAICDLGDVRRDEDGNWPSGNDYVASDERHARVCRAIVRIGKRNPARVAPDANRMVDRAVEIGHRHWAERGVHPCPAVTVKITDDLEPHPAGAVVERATLGGCTIWLRAETVRHAEAHPASTFTASLCYAVTHGLGHTAGLEDGHDGVMAPVMNLGEATPWGCRAWLKSLRAVEDAEYRAAVRAQDAARRAARSAVRKARARCESGRERPNCTGRRWRSSQR